MKGNQQTDELYPAANCILRRPFLGQASDPHQLIGAYVLLGNTSSLIIIRCFNITDYSKHVRSSLSSLAHYVMVLVWKAASFLQSK